MTTRIFCSWSGPRSRQLATEVADWVPTVVQDVQPFLSDADVHAGMAWFPRVADALENCTFGVIFLDSASLNSEWILFEAGALMKSFERTRVVPLLFDLRVSDLRGPLAQFQAKIFSEAGMLDVMKSINNTLQAPLEARVLERSFSRGWPELRDRVQTIQSSHAPQGETTPHLDTEDQSNFVQNALEELLTLSRSQNQLLASTVAKREPSQIRREIERMQDRVLRKAKRAAEKQTQKELIEDLNKAFPRTLKTLGWSESMLKAFLEKHSVIEADVPS